MPKLNGIQILERLRERLLQLEAGEEIAAKEIRSLLTPKQQQELEDAWKAQQTLRQGKRARTAKEEKALGWKSKREVRIEVFKGAIEAAEDDVGAEYERLQLEAMKRQMRIYMETMEEALVVGKDVRVAKKMANNALSQARLNRMDGQRVLHQNKRDQEIFLMEQHIQQKARDALAADELEQIEILEEHEKALKTRTKKIR